MPMKELKVAVVGCGSAGPAVSTLLARQGHDVSLFERAPALGPVGTGFVIQPTGLWVLEQLGLRDLVIEHGGVINSLCIERFVSSGQTRRLIELEYGSIAKGLFGLGMYRPTILSFLTDAMTNAGAKLCCGVEVGGLGGTPSQRTLLTNGGEIGPFDLVVFSNGAQSESREWLGLPHSAKPHPWGALWAIVPDLEERFEGRLYQVLHGTQKMLGVLPTGTRPEGQGNEPLVSLFWSVRADQANEVLSLGKDAIANEILQFAPDLDAVLSRIKSLDQWSFSGYMDITMRRSHTDGAVVIGDAAHSMTPQLGNGVNLALYDAWTLAHSIGTRASLPDALDFYASARRRHLAYYQRATRWITHLFQSSVPGLGALRNVGFAAARSLPPVQRQMVRSMAGIKRGVLRPSYPLDGSPGNLVK